jgi:hypothetical protein
MFTRTPLVGSFVCSQNPKQSISLSLSVSSTSTSSTSTIFSQWLCYTTGKKKKRKFWGRTISKRDWDVICLCWEWGGWPIDVRLAASLYVCSQEFLLYLYTITERRVSIESGARQNKWQSRKKERKVYRKNTRDNKLDLRFIAIRLCTLFVNLSVC